MSEYICNTEDKCGMCEAYRTAEPIVRCRDCLHYSGYSASHTKEEIGTCDLGLEWTDLYSIVEPSGFCAWGTKTEFVTCKCGEDIERIDRIQTCPSCGRKVMA